MAPSFDRRTAIKAGAGAVAVTAVAGSSVAPKVIAQDSGWTGEITFYAQAYTPN